MCLIGTTVRGLEQWNWDGDRIIHRPIVPASRKVLGYPRNGEYEIDPRGFLARRGNAVMNHTLEQEVRTFVEETPNGSWAAFRSRDAGSFDYRADVLGAFVGERIPYRNRPGRREPWLFPEETLHIGSGDCEDRALLLASLLIHSGVSAYNVRVCLGAVIIKPRGERKKSRDHSWVMYKNERGRWQLLEPLDSSSPETGHTAKKTKKPRRVASLATSLLEWIEYRPAFAFNDEHVWCLEDKDVPAEADALSTKRRWSSLEPAFVGAVHKTILNDALSHLEGPDRRVIAALNRNFSRAVLGIFGPVVDNVDRRTYDPREHFDNGYVDEGWAWVDQNLAKFKADNRDLESFALAAHAIADFYAHSSFGHFAKVRRTGPFQPRLELYDHADPASSLAMPLSYQGGSTFDLEGNQFTVNEHYYHGTGAERAALHAGKVITGRYAQRKDTQGNLLDHVLLEGATYIPEELEKAPDFGLRGSLPHHGEIAVDHEGRDSHHCLYRDQSSGPSDRLAYENQFLWRSNAARYHIRVAFDRQWIVTG